MTLKIPELLKEDVENRKIYTALGPFTCGGCGELVQINEEFVYIGGKKICNNCQGEIIESLENQV